MTEEKPTKRGPRFKDLSGQRIGRLTVLHVARTVQAKHGTRIIWLCRCDCGATIESQTGNLSGGHTKSCGCLNSDTTAARNWKHGLAYSGTYYSWQQAKRRCFNVNATQYPHYGGRGITMCDQWRADFSEFLADMGPRPEGHTLDRIDNDGNYEPANCRWATQREQAANQRKSILITKDGVTHCLAEWARIIGISQSSLYGRWKRAVRADILRPKRSH